MGLPPSEDGIDPEASARWLGPPSLADVADEPELPHPDTSMRANPAASPQVTWDAGGTFDASRIATQVYTTLVGAGRANVLAYFWHVMVGLLMSGTG